MTIEEIVREHREDYDYDCSDYRGCKCGWTPIYDDFDKAAEAWVDHFLVVCQEAGLR